MCPISRRAADGSEIFSPRDNATIRSDQECTVPGADGRFDSEWDRGVRGHSGGTALSKKAQGSFFHRIVERLKTHDGVRARRFPRAGHQTRRTWQCPPSQGSSWRRRQKHPPMRSPAVANGPPRTFRWPCCRASLPGRRWPAGFSPASSGLWHSWTPTGASAYWRRGRSAFGPLRGEFVLEGLGRQP